MNFGLPSVNPCLSLDVQTFTSREFFFLPTSALKSGDSHLFVSTGLFEALKSGDSHLFVSTGLFEAL